MRRPIAFRRIADVAASNTATIVERWLPGGRRQAGEWVVRNPRRLDRHAGSFSVNLRTGVWGDFATDDRGGDMISLAAYLYGLNQADAAVRVAEMLGIDPYEDRPR